MESWLQVKDGRTYTPTSYDVQCLVRNYCLLYLMRSVKAWHSPLLIQLGTTYCFQCRRSLELKFIQCTRHIAVLSMVYCRGKWHCPVPTQGVSLVPTFPHQPLAQLFTFFVDNVLDNNALCTYCTYLGAVCIDGCVDPRCGGLL